MKKILACLFIMAALPLLASSVYNTSAPFAQVAIAGHVIGGTVWCECGSSSNCVCDPGEIPGTNVRTPSSDRDGKVAIQDASPDLDFGSGALLMALAFLVMVRLLRP